MYYIYYTYAFRCSPATFYGSYYETRTSVKRANLSWQRMELRQRATSMCLGFSTHAYMLSVRTRPKQTALEQAVSLVTKLRSIGLVTCRLRFESHQGSFASNLEHAANLLCDHVNSASYPQWDWKWVIAYGLRDEGLVWLIGAAVCLMADPQVQLFADAGNG